MSDRVKSPKDNAVAVVPPSSESEPAETNDAEYMAWVKARIDKGRQQMTDPRKRLSEREVWKSFGFDY